METRRLQMLLEFSRLGSMREVAETLGTTTSTVSQQIAQLARETGAELLEPDGRRVRLTPSGRRLAQHAETIMAAVEAARLDLDPDAEPAGTLRIAGFATAVRRSLLPIVAELARSHPKVQMIVYEYEPAEALELLMTDALDLALTYDYNLAPAATSSALQSVPLWSVPWGLGVPTQCAQPANAAAPAVFDRFREHDWIGNSRNHADEVVIRTIASMAGFEPRVTHRCDSLDLVEDLILAGLGVGLLPADRALPPGVRVLALSGPPVRLRSYAVTRKGRSVWAPLALVLDRLTTTVAAHGGSGRRTPAVN